MKKNILILCWYVFGLLFAILIGWRMWPRSLSDIIPVDKASIISFSATASIGGIKNGEPHSDIYNMNSDQTDSEVLQEILELLDSSAYRADYRNFLHGYIDSVEADNNYDGRVFFVVLEGGNNKEEYVEIQFLSNSLIVVQQDNDSDLMIYHPTNRNVLDSLISHIQENGTN